MSLSTQEVAEHMLASGKAYTAATLKKELGLGQAYVSGKFYNIFMAKKYKTVLTCASPRTLRVVDIEGKQREQELWSTLLRASL